MKKGKKIKLFILGLTVLCFILAFSFFSPVIFQEGSPTPLIGGIIKLNFTDQKIVKLDEDRGKYLTKSKGGKNVLINKLNKEGYKFIEQMGSGYLFRNKNLDILLVSRRSYSRFYSIWNVGESMNLKNNIEWAEYKNEKYGFVFDYPLVSINSKWWGDLTEEKPFINLALPNQVLNKNNNFYLTQKYDPEIDRQTGVLEKKENNFIPEYKSGDFSYPVPWHIVILDARNEDDLDRKIKQRLGSGCSYKSKEEIKFKGNYRVEIEGDGKDLGSTKCPVNYINYIIYSPEKERVAFWSTGQECQIGLRFSDCFDQKISNSFHFLN
jgi:hypothetical protein